MAGIVVDVFAQESQGSGLLGGPDLLVFIMLALGAALVVGNLLAIFRPPPQSKEGDLPSAPLARSVTMAAVGLVVSVWAIASLVT